MPLMIGQARRNTAFFTVNKEQIDIRAMVELAAAEFSESKDTELRRRLTQAGAKLRGAFLIHDGKTDIGQTGELSGRLFKRSNTGDLAKSDARHLAGFPQAKR